MHESFLYSKKDVANSPDVPEALKNKISFMDTLKEISGIYDDTDVDEAWFLRVDEVATAYTSSREIAQTLVAIEYAIAHNKGQFTEEALERVGEMAHEILSPEFPNVGEEEIRAFTAAVQQKMAQNGDFLDAFHEALADRKIAMEQNQGFEVYVDSEGVVSRSNEHRLGL